MKLKHITESTDLGSGFQDPDKSGKKLKIQKMRELVERAKHVRANSKKPKIVKPNTGHESPHPYDNAGFVGEADLDEISMQDIKKGAKVAAVTGAIALGGAGIGKVGDYMNQSSFDHSIQLPQLEMYLDYAEAQKDQRMIKQLTTRIRNHEGRLSMGKGDIGGRDGTPLTFEVVYDKENPNFDPLGDPMMLNKKFTDARDNMPEGKSPHKKGTPKYKKHMAAMHAEGKEPNDKGVDLVLPRGKIQVLKAEDKDYNRGVLIELLEDGGYDMAYWYDKFKTYPVEVLVDGKSIKKDAKKVTMKYHPELEEAKNKKPELPKQNNPVAKHSRNKSGAGTHVDRKKEAKKRGDFSPIDEAQYSADKAALLNAVLHELEKEVLDADNTRMLRRLARLIGKRVFKRDNGALTLEDRE
jgi:hypothetical protein